MIDKEKLIQYLQRQLENISEHSDSDYEAGFIAGSESTLKIVLMGFDIGFFDAEES